TGNVDSTFLSVDGTQLMENDPTGGSGSNPTRKMAKITEQTISSSKLPDAIKQAMIENPIAQPSMTGPNFTLDD
ncbi:MAG: hypothetical protein GTO02_02645, partial [Candidatus Dadabacteria bacterium]|nr:hypothetical protein [Candidatus Dadabacteria bacterium]